jgi:cysteine desulfurase
MIYLDHHATTPVDPRVLNAMLPYFTESFGNAASRQYRYGWEALEAVDRARAQVAELVGAEPKAIVFTSGATEANNLALKGLLEVSRPARPHVVTVVTEHKSVLDSAARLRRDGCELTVLPVQADGQLDLDAW